MFLRGQQRVMIWRVGLKHHLRPGALPAGPTSHLCQQLKGALAGTKIR
jgi:hypothetical protein